MRVFNNREDSKYKNVLDQLLSIGKRSTADYPNLIESCVLSKNELDACENADATRPRCIKIDLLGMSGTVLFDKKNRFTKNSHFHQIKKIFEHIDLLNKENGIYLKIRILLQYPYSLAGQNRILAESWENRSFIGPEVASKRNEYNLAPHLKDDDIQHSNLLKQQAYCLENLMSIYAPIIEKLNRSPINTVEIRFAVISTLHCGLRINNYFVCDPYHYGRELGEDNCAMNLTPVVLIDANEDKPAFEAFCNHFQYVWECDSTLDYGDVAHQEKGKRPVFIRKPEKLLTNEKIDRLRTGGAKKSKQEWDRYSKRLLRIVDRICPIVGQVDQPEVGFLSAAWEDKHDGSIGLSEPAELIDQFFKEDFHNEEQVRVSFLMGGMGESFQRDLFAKLDSSTFGIIIVTKETDDGYCKPNIYTELGYLMRKNKLERTFIAAEIGVELGSNLSNQIISRFERRENNMKYVMMPIYKDILKAMYANGIISEDTLTKVIAKRFK